MNNSNKKYGMGGAVQSFSSPMLAQGMQGGLSGFGTSGLGTFADGGQVSEIERILAKYKAMESNKPKADETSEFLRKSWEGKNLDDYIMYSDKYKRGGKMAKGGIMEHGLEEGDKIVKEVDNKWLIVKSKEGVHSVIDVEKGSRFIVGLDDSKMSGKRTSAKAGVKQAMDYINYLKSTKMANGGTLDDAKIYVADLAEYNNGRLVGKWLDLSDYSSGAEVMEAIQEMLDEQTKKDKYGDVHEEYAIHDFEGFPRSFYSEYMGESDFDALYEMMKVADSSNLPLEVLMEAVSDLGYEDDPERVAEAYYSSVPASMGNEWRDFAYDYIDSIGNITEAVSKPEYYFDFESFGSDVRMDYTDEELEEMGYNDLSDEELGEQMADEMGGVKYLGEELIERYFDYDKFGRELEYDFISVRGKDGDYYFFNRNFAKGGEVEDKNQYDFSIRTLKDNLDVLNEDYDYEDFRGTKEDVLKRVNDDIKKGKIVYAYVGIENVNPNWFYESRDLQRLRMDLNQYGEYAKGGEVGNFKEGDIVKSTDKKDGYGTIVEIKGNMAVIDFEDRLSNHIKFLSLSDLKKVSSNKFAKGGDVSSQKIYEVEYEIGGKKHTSQFLMYDSDRVENLLPPATKIISIKEKFAKGGKVGKYEIWKELFHLRKDGYAIVSLNGFDESIGYVMGLELDDSEIKKVGERSYKTLYAKGGKVGFEGLAKKVAKRYVGKKVSKEYQAEYGKTYDAKEAKEVGNKVAGKVYQQQVAKKKIIRKLQRKTN